MGDTLSTIVVLTSTLGPAAICIILAIRMAVRNARRSRCPNCGSAKVERDPDYPLKTDTPPPPMKCRECGTKYYLKESAGGIVIGVSIIS